MAIDESVEQEICPKCEQELCQCSLGEKRVCPACEARFYDLNTRSKKPKCPHCGVVYIRDDDTNTTLKTKSEFEAEGGVSDDEVSSDYNSDTVDDNVKDEDDSDLDDENDEDAEGDLIPATDEVELKIEDDDEEEAGAKPRKKSDGGLGDELIEAIMDDDTDEVEDIELDGDGAVPK